MDEAVAKHIHGRLALLQHDIADEGFKLPILGLHVHENHLAEDRLKPFDLNTNGTAHGPFHGCLRCQFKCDVSD